MREAGLALMSLVMEEEVRHLAGERHEQHPARRAHRWGKEAGYCVVDGQKVPISAPVCARRRIASNGWAVTSCSSAVGRWSTRCGTS